MTSLGMHRHTEIKPFLYAMRVYSIDNNNHLSIDSFQMLIGYLCVCVDL